MRPLAVVMVEIGPDYLFEVGGLRISRKSRHSARTVRTKRSAITFAFGDRIGVFTIRTPSLRRPVGCINSVSCCDCFVFVDQPAEEVASLNRRRRCNGLASRRRSRRRVGRL
jgi:hypothetical protein